MKKFTFIVIMDNGVLGLPGGVIINCEAEDWISIIIKEDFSGEFFDVATLKEYLSTAYCMFGHGFDPEHHTPRLLYEALIGKQKYKILLEGDIPENPLEYEDLPDDACD